MISRISMAGVATIAALVAQGAGAADFVDTAPVVATAPILEKVNTPRQECWNEQVVSQAPSNTGSPLGAIIGGIAGGVIGHQIGSGRGNAVATGAGAVAGAVIGDKVDPNGGVFGGNANAGTNSQVVQRCRTVDDWQDVVPRLQRHLSLQRARRQRAPAVRPGSERAAWRSAWCPINVRRCPTTARPTVLRPTRRPTRTDFRCSARGGRRWNRRPFSICRARRPTPAQARPQ